MEKAGTPNGEVIRNYFTIQTVVGLPFGTSKYPAFVVHPFPYPATQMHELVYGYEIPEGCQDTPQHAIHLALQWQDELKSDSSMTMARIAEKERLFSRKGDADHGVLEAG